MSTGETPAAEADYAAILDRVRAGEPAAIDDLLERAHDVARRYSLAVCGRAPDSDDAMQEALLRTFRHAGRIREPRAFRAWLYRTVKNACLVGRRRPAAMPAVMTTIEEASAEGREPADASPTAVDLLEMGESRETLRHALESLPPAHREIVFLRDLEGLSTREVAHVLGISEANAKVRLHRAHEKLRRKLSAGPRAAATSSRSARREPSPRRRRA
jgi:RNA polymerase sigma-70 factor (ECF subfamily)